MAVKKTIEQSIKEIQNKINVLSSRYADLLLEHEDGETRDQKEKEKRELKKQIADLNSELKFLQKMQGPKIDKRAEREAKKRQDDIISWVKKMPSSISNIVKTIPKE